MKEELKTLKDIATTLGIDGEYPIIETEKLREEANKWIAKIEAKIKEKEGQFDDFGIDLGMAYAETGEAIIRFIKHFFNLEGKK